MSHPYRGIAIVVGISDYVNIAKLEGAVNDANEMTKNLREHHFDVIDLINPSIDKITRGVIELNLRLSVNSYNVVIVYYAGHGAADFNSHFILGPEYTFKNNQLVINGLNIEEKIIKEICAISVPGHKKRSLLVILDTCRTKNIRSIDEFRVSENQHGNKGSIGILVGYACGRGLTATDGYHGLYTQFILEEFFKPGICVFDALSTVNIRVENEGGNNQKPQMVVDDLHCFKFCINELPETLEGLKEEIACLKSELKRKSITIKDRTEENIKIKTELEEQRYTRDGVRAEYNGRIAALDDKIKLLQMKIEELKLENEKLEEELEHVQINQRKFQLENSTVIDDSEIMEKIYELTGGALWTNNKDRLSWQPNYCSKEFKETSARIMYIDLRENNLKGMLPQELGRLLYITYLDLSVNQLRGAIPVELGELKRLEHLDLSSNQLTGAIPVELGELSKLVDLRLHSNRLTGEIPKELEELSALKYLRLDGNQLTGAIPVELGELSKLVDLRLSNNKLTGAIPVELGELSKLEYLYLHCNKLTGAIPVELGKLLKLQYLYLDSNKLTGKIPVELGTLSKLELLYLFHNQLTGAIPVELGELSKLVDLRLYSNELTGAIPVELGELSKLEYLYLHCNKLTGAIPPELGKLLNLENLWLNDNQLTGTIPIDLGELSELKVLFLDGNQLTGRIPVKLGKLLKLEQLHFENNQLTGGPPIIAGCNVAYHPQRLEQDSEHKDATHQAGKSCVQS